MYNPLSSVAEPGVFRVYSLKFKLIAAESQTGPGKEEDDKFVTLISNILDCTGSFFSSQVEGGVGGDNFYVSIIRCFYCLASV